MTALYKRAPWLLAVVQCSDCRHLVHQVFCPRFFPQDKWKSAISFKHPINMSYKSHRNWAPKAQFYYSFLSLSGIASSLRFQVIIALCTLEWHKLALWAKNQLAGCPSLLAWPGHDKHRSTNAYKRHPKCASTFWRRYFILFFLRKTKRLTAGLPLLILKTNIG